MAPQKKEKKDAAPSKAKAAAQQIKKGAGKKDVKVRTKVHFYKPKTLKLARNPRAPVRAVPSLQKMDKYRVIKYPLTTEVIVFYPKRYPPFFSLLFTP
jgi:large subunit ribosomal protein L23Ae